MAETLSTWSHYLLEGFFNKHGDPRALAYPFMFSIRVPAFILTSYLLFVLYFGPRWMHHRKAFSLKTPMLAYNTCMSLYNGWVFIRLALHPIQLSERILDTTFPGFSDTSDFTMMIANESYIYIVSKYIDLLDTVFFVLRKKPHQVSSLHLYHHFTVALNSWIVFRLCVNCYICSLFGFLNSGIHFLMYGYYALSTLGTTVRGYLWWKRYLTQLQLGQFLFLFIHSVYFIVNQRGYSLYYTFNYIFNSIVYIVLFSRFYVQTYRGGSGKIVKDKRR